MSAGEYGFNDAYAAAGLFLANVTDVCERIEIGGSVRRGLSAKAAGAVDGLSGYTVGDLEMAAIPRWDETAQDLFGETVERENLLWSRIAALQEPPGYGDNGEDQLAGRTKQMFLEERLAAHGQTPFWPWIAYDKNEVPFIRWGPKYHKVALPTPNDTALLPCDLFLATPVTWGYIFALRTGPAAWNRALVLPKTTPTAEFPNGGLKPADVEIEDGVVYKAGEPVPVPDEGALFELWELNWVPPHERGAYAQHLQA